MRAHGPFVSDEEVENVVTFLKAQGEPDYLDCVLDDGSSSSDGGAPGGGPATVPAVVFIADKDGNGENELYASLNDGANVVKLSTGSNVEPDFKISPDGTRVAYRADQDTPGVIELYVNSINGGTPVKVSGPLVAGGNVDLRPDPPNPPLDFDVFNWSPDSSLIA